MKKKEKKKEKIEILTIWCHRGKPIYLRSDGKASIESKLLREKRTYTLFVRGEKLDSDSLGHPVDPDNKINRNRGEKKIIWQMGEHIYWIIYKNRDIQNVEVFFFRILIVSSQISFFFCSHYNFLFVSVSIPLEISLIYDLNPQLI